MLALLEGKSASLAVREAIRFVLLTKYGVEEVAPVRGEATTVPADA